MLPPPLPRLQSDQPTTPVLEPVSSAKLPLPSPFPGFEGGQEIPDTYFHEKRHSSPAAVAKEVTRPEQADDAVQQPAVSHRPGVWNPEMGIRFTDPAASDQASGSRAHKQPSETGEATLQPLGDSLEAGAVEPSPSAGSEADVSDTMYDEDEIARLQQEDTIPEDEERDDELLGLLTESLKDEVAEGEFEYYNSATVSDQDDTDKVAHESDDSDEEMAEVEDMMKEISDDDGGDVEGDMDVHDYMLTGDARADYVEEDDPDPELGSMDSPTYDPETGSPSYWPSSGHPLGLDGAMGSKRAQAFSESVTARPDAAAAAGEVSPTSSEVAWDVMDAALVEVGKSSPVSARRLSAPSPASVDYSAQRPMPVVPASSPTETVRHPAVLPPTQRPVVPSSSNRRSENVDLGLDSEDEDEGVTMGGPETPDVEAVNAGSAILDTLQPSPPSQRKETTFSGDATPLDTRSPLAGIIDDALDRDTVTSTPATPPAQTRDDTSPALENGPNTQGRHAENMRKVFPYGVPDANSRDIVEEHFPSTETARPLPSAIPEPSEPTSPISPIKTAQIAGHDVEMGDAEASVAMGSRILDLVQPRPPETNDARLLDPVSHTTDRLAPPSHDDANANFHRLSSTPARSPQSVRPIEEIDLSQTILPEAVIADSVDSPITTLVPGSSRPASREGGPDHAAVPVSAQEEDIQREEVTQEPLSRFHGQFSGLDQPSQLTMPSQELGTPFSDTAPPQVEQMEMINEDMQVDDDLLEVAASPERKVEDTGITETAGVGVVPRSVSQIAVAHDSALISELNGSRSPLVFTSTQQLTLEGIETEQNDFGPPSSTPQTAMATEQGADVERLGDVRSHNIDVDEQTVSYPDLAKSQSPDESQLKLETQAAFPLPEADEPIEDSQMEVEAQHPPAGTQPSEQPVVEQASAVSAQTPQRQPRLVARKSLTARLTEVPEVISAWFTPRRSSVRSAQTQEGATMTTPAGKGGQQSPSKGVRFSFVSHVSPPNPANIHRKSSITRSASPPPLSRGASQGISTSLSYFYPLTDLESQLNTPTSTIDILAVVTSASVEPTRAKAGPRDFYTLFHITDAAIYEQQNANGDEAALRKDVRVEVFRP
ncbi:hypothetical protein H2203_001694 [Taxawa tesnikishii (nom. ined.)]|nr:hypothetical protein H2203_001694 [Dothideales sp. JES 119]